MVTALQSRSKRVKVYFASEDGVAVSSFVLFSFHDLCLVFSKHTRRLVGVQVTFSHYDMFPT